MIYHLIMVKLPSRNSIPFDSPATYQIIVHGRIDPSWSDRLEGMTICQIASDVASTTTTLDGELSDQAALAGVLNTIYELHLPLLSVKRLSVSPTEDLKL